MNVDGPTEGSTEVGPDNTEVIESEEDASTEKKRIIQSRWVAKSNVPRYDKKTADALNDIYGATEGWRQGARIHRVNSK